MEISEYTETWNEYCYLLAQVEDLADEYLVEEIAFDNIYHAPDIDKIIADYGELRVLTPEAREKLIGFYILINCEEELWAEGTWTV